MGEWEDGRMGGRRKGRRQPGEGWRVGKSSLAAIPSRNYFLIEEFLLPFDVLCDFPFSSLSFYFFLPSSPLSPPLPSSPSPPLHLRYYDSIQSLPKLAPSEMQEYLRETAQVCANSVRQCAESEPDAGTMVMPLASFLFPRPQ